MFKREGVNGIAICSLHNKSTEPFTSPSFLALEKERRGFLVKEDFLCSKERSSLSIKEVSSELVVTEEAREGPLKICIIFFISNKEQLALIE